MTTIGPLRYQVPTQPLNEAEKARLVRLERTVDRAVDAAGKIAGEALATIRDERLYRLTHSSFEGYVLDRWGFSRATAYRMIEAVTMSHRELSEDETAGQRVSPRDKPSTDSGDFEDEEQSSDIPEPVGIDWCRLSGSVVEAGDGELVLLIDEGAEYPVRGTKVLVTWAG